MICLVLGLSGSWLVLRVTNLLGLFFMGFTDFVGLLVGFVCCRGLFWVFYVFGLVIFWGCSTGIPNRFWV